jgi:squalene cyclase
MNVLDTPLLNEFGTIRTWFISAMQMLWRETESFNGKRPNGDSGWDFDLILAVAVHRGLADTQEFEITKEQEQEIEKEIAQALEDWYNETQLTDIR